jgi:hypothetical protein
LREYEERYRKQSRQILPVTRPADICNILLALSKTIVISSVKFKLLVLHLAISPIRLIKSLPVIGKLTRDSKVYYINVKQFCYQGDI